METRRGDSYFSATGGLGPVHVPFRLDLEPSAVGPPHTGAVKRFGILPARLRTRRTREEGETLVSEDVPARAHKPWRRVRPELTN
jgi:hypothetical protein